MQVKCIYSSNESIFTPGRTYDVKVIYGNDGYRLGTDVVLIDDHDDIWRFWPTYRGGEISSIDFSASFERY